MTDNAAAVNVGIRKFDMKMIPQDAVCVFIGRRRTGKSTLVKDLLWHHQNIPIGTVIQQNYFQIASGADFLATLKWMNELVDLGKQITGNDAAIIHTLFGTLGTVGYFTGYANAAQIDEARAKIAANAEWFPKFLEGGKYAGSGTVVQRHMIKIA